MEWRVFFLALSAILLVILCRFGTKSQVLNPPYFNLAEGKDVYSTATCGEKISDREWFCKLTGANYAGTGIEPWKGSPSGGNPQQQGQIVKGQLCDFCDARDPSQAHPPSYSVDGTERWWQSPPLSRGVEYNEVNLTVDLGQEFHVAYVFIKMANSPRPGVWALERSTDYGQSWKPWQYFADTPSDCLTFFNTTLDSIESDDSVLCTTGFSKVVPLEGGEIVVSLVNDRPNANNFSYATTLQGWTIATNVRLRLLRTKTLLGHLMAVARQDPTVTRRYYYSIKDISIGGRCVCNGHAEFCDKRDPRNPEKLLCRCQHNTCGAQCDQCCPGFVQKKWKKATEDSVNECEACNCHEHSDECFYDEVTDLEEKSLDIYGEYAGGGICQNCRHNTQGINCHECRPGYYRPDGVPMNSTDACRQCRCNNVYSTGECEEGTGKCKCREQYSGDNCDVCARGYYGYPTCVPCTCNVNGTENDICEVGGGQCPCKPNYIGSNCDQCNFAFYGFPDCMPCQCNTFGSLGRNCDPQNGQCPCRNNFGNRTCDICTEGYFGFPTCEFCTCDPTGCEQGICNKDDGSCLCKENFAPPNCDKCAVGYYNYPTCSKCDCNEEGSRDASCDRSGQCTCKVNFAGPKCDRCAPGYYKYPECKACSCDIYGSNAVSCDQESGQCRCRDNFQSLMCNQCKEGFYNYPVCEECNCNPAGAKEIAGLPLGGCGTHQNGQLCECKERVRGHTCDACKPGFWNLNINNPFACDSCDCDVAGTIGGSEICDFKTGQCLCKLYVQGKRCNECKAGSYMLTAGNIFGCVDCNCDIGGAWDNNCDKSSGQCRCRPRVTGKTCDRPDRTHFYPNLHQKKYELEDGRTPSGGAVRFGFDDNVLPNYSWRGYAIFSTVQPTIVVDIEIDEPDIYHILYRYVNRNLFSKPGTVVVTPESSADSKQKSIINFQSTTTPMMATVTMGSVPTGFIMNPGKWSVALTTQEDIFVDYVVLLPESYFQASVLKERVKDACPVPLQDKQCIHYVYIDVKTYKIFRGENGYFAKDNQRVRTQLLVNAEILKDLNTPAMAVLDLNQPGMYIDLIGLDPDQYVLVVNYHTQTPGVKEQTLDVNLASTVNRDKGKVSFPPCKFSSLCRAVVTNVTNGRVGFYDISTDYVTLSFDGEDNVDLAIDSIVAVPKSVFNVNFLKPTFKCVMINKKCVGSSWLSEASVKIELEGGDNSDKVSKPEDLPPGIVDVGVKVVKLDKVTPVITIDGSVSRPGKYSYIVHYYQPNLPTMNVKVDVEIGGKSYPGIFKADYCPSVTGCRGLVEFEGVDVPESIDLQEKDFKVILNNTEGNTVWLDYFVIIPTTKDKNDYLDRLPIDNSGYFLTECAGDGWDVKDSASEFCKTAVFSVTTDYNNGAEQCNCHIDGARSFECSEYGGQCPCKANIIGRKCTQCKTGYYGFPDCQRCDCPSGLCHHKSGKCICPPRVTGENCNICLENTFGYDPLIGCEECNCHQEGIKNSNMSCDINTGQCSCKDNINARTCSVCKAGFYQFPNCAKCNCDARGTTEDICDQRSAQCICKENVYGTLCDRCKAGTYYLEERNPMGCTKCFCFGTTDRCRSSNYRRAQISTMAGWNVTNIDDPPIYEEDRKLTLDARKGAKDILMPMYWVAPKEYLGNRVTSYGGKLTYSILFYIPNDGTSRGKISSDLILMGNNMTISHVVSEQPAVGKELPVEIYFTENKFNHESTGAYVTRSQFMSVLSRLESLHIRVNYYTVIQRASLTDVRLDSATPDGPGEEANNVEQCYCPPSYTGTSCEECVEGYYKQRNGTGFVCVPCNCSGSASSCDRETGECIGCRYNTKGFHCEECETGYYKNKDTGRCNICACPKATPDNNFATTCEVIDGDVVLKCDCLPGYSVPRCDACESGFFGNPSEVGGSCQPCRCSGNIDVNDPQSCDPLTGDCLKCLYNTTGPNCDKCGAWLFGDAMDMDDKECQPCTCDRCGTEFCDDTNGVCNCLPNVVGADCHECAAYTYGFDECEGCKPCECGAASDSPQCNGTSGHCSCKPGVKGKKCNECVENYWDYGPNGCKECMCVGIGATTCDRITGECRCTEGHTGRDCKTCIKGWIMVPDQGCQECDNCVFLLLHDIDYLISNLTLRYTDLEDVSVGVFAMRRLTKINDTVNELRPRVDNMVYDPSLIDIDPLRRLLIEVQNIEKNTITTTRFTKTRSGIIMSDAQKMLNDSSTLMDLLEEAETMSNDSVKFAQDILKTIQEGIRHTNIDQLLAEAEEILKEIKGRDFSSKDTGSQNELTKAVDLLARVRNLNKDAMDQMDKYDEVAKKLGTFDAKLKDLREKSRESLQTSSMATRINNRNQAYLDRIGTTTERIEDARKMTDGTLKMGQELLRLARIYLDEAKKNYKNVETESNNLDEAMERLRNFAVDLAKSNNELRPLVDNATDHAFNLEQEADYLKSLILDTQRQAENALKAAQAYENIVAAIRDAGDATESAINATTIALDMSSGLGDRATVSKGRSQVLLDRAKTLKVQVDGALRDQFDRAIQKVDLLVNKNERVRVGVMDIERGLNMLPADGYSKIANDAAMRAMDAKTRSDQVITQIDDIRGRIKGDLERSKDIKLAVDAANDHMNAAEEHILKVRNLVPDATKLLDRLQITANRINTFGLDLSLNISALKEKIALTRGQANRIRVAMQFYSNTTVQARNPSNLNLAGSFTKLDMFFKTTKANGFLMYVGPDQTEPSASNDYMALEILNSNVVFKFDLGSGPARIRSSKAVDDGKWHQVSIERIGRSGKITVRTGDEPDIVNEGISPGTMAVLELDPHKSKFFIGGVPNDAQIPAEVGQRRFEGCMEEVLFDSIPVGLWNHVKGENNKNGCIERDSLQSAPTNGFRFNGNGYIVLKKGRFRPHRKSQVNLMFKTYSDDGLMFFVHKNRDFLSIELREGKVLFQFDLGGGRAKLESTQKYNDGQWHSIDASRRDQNGLLKVDDVKVAEGRSVGDLTQLSIDEEIFIGGYRGTKIYDFPVTSMGFDGCIKDVQLSRIARDLNDNIGAKNIIPGCPVQVARIVSFLAKRSGFAAMPAININRNFDATMKIKSLEPEALLMYAANQDQSNSFSLSMVNGKIVMVAVVDGQRKVIESKVETYNDGRWHYLTITKDGSSLQLDVDDHEMVKGDLTKRRIKTSSKLYFGGVPSNYAIVDLNSATLSRLIGCIGDATVNGNFVNFATAPPGDRVGASLAGCPIKDPAAPTELPGTIEPPVIPVMPTGTVIQTDECKLKPAAAAYKASGTASGTRFGFQPESRNEYDRIPGNFRINSEFSCEFKTTATDGLIFYVSDDRHTDYIYLIMRDGDLVYAFNSGSGPAIISSTKTFNDGKWHRAVFWREQKNGRLTVDDQAVYNGASVGNTRSINVAVPYYVGGMPEDTAKAATGNLAKIARMGFVGCIRNFQINGNLFGPPTRSFGTQPCYPNVEIGAFFGIGGGYLVNREAFKVGLDLDILVEIRPRSQNGVILSVSSPRGDYLVLQLVEGELIFSVDNGAGEISAKHKALIKPGLCDGNWHKIQAVKAKNVVTLNVDGIQQVPGIGAAGVSSTDTNDPLHIGGVPDPVNALGVRTAKTYVGCIRNLQFDLVRQNTAAADVFGDVNTAHCPIA